MPQPVPMVQCSGISSDKGWNSVLMCGFLQAQCTWIQEVLESMVGVAYFSTMDFESRFCQVRMVPESQQYTTFTVGNLEFYEFTPMLFGLCNTPMTFQYLMQNTLGELKLTYCIIYLDDVIVFSHMEGEHLEHLCIIFQ